MCSLAVDTVCVAYDLVARHGAIKNQPNHMRRCTLINELNQALADRGITLTKQLASVLDAADNVAFAVERKAATDGEQPRAMKQRNKRIAQGDATTLLVPLSR